MSRSNLSARRNLRKMKRLSLTLVALCVIACSSSKSLTQARAADLIANAIAHFETPQRGGGGVSVWFITGQRVIGEVVEPYRTLQSLGLVSIRDSPSVAGSGEAGRFKGVYLTPKGRAEAVGRGVDESWAFATVSGYEFVSVTQITEARPNSAVVEFEWKRKLNDLGEALVRMGLGPDGNRPRQGQDPNPPQKGTAHFKHDDDGWHLEGLSL